MPALREAVVVCPIFILSKAYKNAKAILLSQLFSADNNFFLWTGLGDRKAARRDFARQFKPNEPGCAVLIAKQGRVIYKKAFGSADLELNTEITPDMVFKLASITKQFTAVAILQLVEKGKISLQDSLQKFIPDFPSKGKTITIENLLTHTSGIRDYMQIDYAHSFMERWDFKPKQLIDSFKNYALEFDPGTRFSYSNSGYYLLGYIIEMISGKSYQTYIRDNLLTPLALTYTHFDSAGIIIPGRLHGYRKEGTNFKNADYWSPTIAYSAGPAFKYRRSIQMVSRTFR